MGGGKYPLEGLGMINRNVFWQDKTVLVTGHTGFKGSWLSLWLQQLGANVVGYALEPPTDPSLFEMARVAQGMTSVIGDARDLAAFQAVFQTYRPEIVIHMAAQPLVRESYKDPLLTLSTNIMGTAHMLEAARRTGSARVLVSITSDKCYQNKEWVWGYRETDRLGGRDPYSASKAAAELVISTYRDSFMADAGIALASTRAGNVIGGGDWAKDRLVPDIMRSVMRGRPVVIRNPQATRPWQHVLEPLNGYLTVAEHLWEHGRAYAEAWNFGPNDDDVKPVSWICDYVTEMWGEGAAWQMDGDDHPHENTLLKLDCSKAKARLGWQPKLNLSEALTWIVEWFQAYQNGADMRAVTEAQIRQFAEK